MQSTAPHFGASLKGGIRAENNNPSTLSLNLPQTPKRDSVILPQNHPLARSSLEQVDSLSRARNNFMKASLRSSHDGSISVRPANSGNVCQNSCGGAQSETTLRAQTSHANSRAQKSANPSRSGSRRHLPQVGREIAAINRLTKATISSSGGGAATDRSSNGATTDRSTNGAATARSGASTARYHRRAKADASVRSSMQVT